MSSIYMSKYICYSDTFLVNYLVNILLICIIVISLKSICYNFKTAGVAICKIIFWSPFTNVGIILYGCLSLSLSFPSVCPQWEEHWRMVLLQRRHRLWVWPAALRCRCETADAQDLDKQYELDTNVCLILEQVHVSGFVFYCGQLIFSQEKGL